MAQRYTADLCLKRMARNRCPECGEPADEHATETSVMAMFLDCNLRADGVVERIKQYRADLDSETCYRLDSVDHGPLPDDYPLHLGSIAKFPGSGKPPEATWNPETECWVAMRWTVVPDPRTVRQGQIVGTSGQTRPDPAAGPHLHMQMSDLDSPSGKSASVKNLELTPEARAWLAEAVAEAERTDGDG